MDVEMSHVNGTILLTLGTKKSRNPRGIKCSAGGTRVVQQDKQRFSAPIRLRRTLSRPCPSPNLLIVTSAAGNVIKIPFSDGLPLCHESATSTIGIAPGCKKHRRAWRRERCWEREKERWEGMRGGGREGNGCDWVELPQVRRAFNSRYDHPRDRRRRTTARTPEISANFPFRAWPRFSAAKGVKAPGNSPR